MLWRESRLENLHPKGTDTGRTCSYHDEIPILIVLGKNGKGPVPITRRVRTVGNDSPDAGEWNGKSVNLETLAWSHPSMSIGSDGYREHVVA
jgi:hypothetical protein